MKVDPASLLSARLSAAQPAAQGVSDGHFGVMLQQWINLSAAAAEGESGRATPLNAHATLAEKAMGLDSPGFVSTVQRFGGPK